MKISWVIFGLVCVFGLIWFEVAHTWLQVLSLILTVLGLSALRHDWDTWSVNSPQKVIPQAALSLTATTVGVVISTISLAGYTSTDIMHGIPPQ